VIYATRSLLTVLCDFARDAEPDSVTTGLAVTPAGDLDGAPEVDPETPVFTDFYLPDAGGSVSAVFGVDLSTPAGQTQGRFVSHPLGDQQVTETDDLHEIVFVAVPPWEVESIGAYGRDGRKRELTVLDADPPEGSLEGA